MRVIVPGRHNTVSKIECVKPTDFGDFRGEFYLIHTESVFHIPLVSLRTRARVQSPVTRPGRGEGAAFSRYDLMVFIALDVLKINVGVSSSMRDKKSKPV